jgi:hypothetical protein
VFEMSRSKKHNLIVSELPVPYRGKKSLTGKMLRQWKRPKNSDKTYTLLPKSAKLFLRLLKNPPAPNAKLKAAARRYQKEFK